MKLFECQGEHCFDKTVAEEIYKSWLYRQRIRYIRLAFYDNVIKVLKYIEDYNFKDNKKYKIVVKIEFEEEE